MLAGKRLVSLEIYFGFLYGTLMILLVMGANSGAAQTVLKSDYHEGCSLQEASLLAVKVLRKSIGGSTVLKPERGNQ